MKRVDSLSAEMRRERFEEHIKDGEIGVALCPTYAEPAYPGNRRVHRLG
jgi:hypothetical protein